MIRLRIPGPLRWAGLAGVLGLLLTGCADEPAGIYREVSANRTTPPATESVESAPADSAPQPAHSVQAVALIDVPPVAAPLPPDDTEAAAATELASTEPVITPVVGLRPSPPIIPNLLPGRSKSNAGPVVPTAKPLPGGIRILVKERTFRPEGRDGTLRVTYDDLDLLKVMNAEPVPVDIADRLPSWLKELDGRRIRIRGFMYPPTLEEGIRGFVLARDNQICCFGRSPKPYDLINILMRDGVTTHYIQNRPFDVVGVFHIVPAASDGTIYELYELDDALVIDK